MERGRKRDGLAARLGDRCDWQCLECGHRFRTVRAAMSAAMRGCPKCGGVDVDLADTGLREWASKAADAVLAA
jgi:predicted  nucleic acid-binding Zn-ribbon protein